MRMSPNLRHRRRVIPAISIASFLALLLRGLRRRLLVGQRGLGHLGQHHLVGLDPEHSGGGAVHQGLQHPVPEHPRHLQDAHDRRLQRRAPARPGVHGRGRRLRRRAGWRQRLGRNVQPGRGQPGACGSAEGARQQLAVQALPHRRLQPHDRPEARRRLRRGGVRRVDLDQRGLFSQYHLSPPTTLAQWTSDCKAFKSHGVGCFVQGRRQTAFSRTPCKRSRTNLTRLWTKASRARSRGRARR